MRKNTIIIVSLLVLAILVTAFAVNAQAQSATPSALQPTTTNERTIRITGTGKAILTPDIAYINIGVHSEGKDAAETVANNNEQSQKVIDALKETGIEAKDIQTTNFSIYPQQQYDKDGKQIGITYVVDNTVYVTIKDLDKIGDLLDAVVTAGANSINSIQFDVADKTKALSDARQAAVKDAETQAEELAQAAGVTLGPVLTITTATGNMPAPMYEGLGGPRAAMEAAVPVSAGQLTLMVDVTMVYEIQ